ncbi:MAG: SIR2 family protein [Betaproteobacteria bacterium]
MTTAADFTTELEAKVAQQLKSQRVGYLLGAGSSYLNGAGYPLAFELWDLIKASIADIPRRNEIQAALDHGANGIEHALDLLDDGGASDTPYRHLVTAALADLFMLKTPELVLHGEFVRRIAQRADPCVKVFSLNYDPLVERAAAHVRVRLADGFLGAEHSYFDPTVFEERIGRIRGTHRGKQFDETVKPIHLLKLHGSLGWYECPIDGVRRGQFGARPPAGTRRLMVPPQRRKAADTMNPPYSALWSTFRGCLGHNAAPINRLVCIGYGFADEHVNAVIEAALARTDFTVLIFSRALGPIAWTRWSAKTNVFVVTEAQCALKGQTGSGHPDLWSFERLAREV